MLWDHGDSNPWEKSGTSNPKTDPWLISSGNPRAVDNTLSFYDSQIDVVNKQLVRQLNGNKPFSKSILMAYLQTCRFQSKKYTHVKNNFIYTLLIHSFYMLFWFSYQTGNYLKKFPCNSIDCFEKWCSIEYLC